MFGLSWTIPIARTDQKNLRLAVFHHTEHCNIRLSVLDALWFGRRPECNNEMSQPSASVLKVACDKERERVCVYNESKCGLWVWNSALDKHQRLINPQPSLKGTGPVACLDLWPRRGCGFLGVCVRHGRWTRPLRCWCVMVFHTP